MTTAATIAWLALAAVGHAAVWIALLNRLHAWGAPRWSLKLAGVTLHAAMATIALGIGWPLLAGLLQRPPEAVFAAIPWSARAYLLACGLVALCPVPWRLWTIARQRPPAALVANHTTAVDVGRRLPRFPGGGPLDRLTLRLPGNECLRLTVHEKTLRLARLDPALAGLRIVHLSDLHFSGRIDRPYFEEVVDAANGLGADLVAVTGDLVDKARCLDWIPHTLGRLSARHGAFYVLGNHDRRVDVGRLTAALDSAGLVRLGRRELTIAGRRLTLVGNELPWFPLHPDAAAEVRANRAGSKGSDGPAEGLRILLSHSPDQFAWARARHFDLMLAGHTHGGQIRLPLVGPLLAPSFHGVKYASGTFHEGPTVMHVSRGVSCLHTLRWNCPPELAVVVLKGRESRDEGRGQE